jgi:hypothetical protein
MISQEEKVRCIKFVHEVMKARYELNATGPEAYDCLTLTAHTQRVLFNRTLPNIVLKDNSAATFIEAVTEGHRQSKLPLKVADKPEHGCVVEMSRSDIPHHIGTWLDVSGGGILHCALGMGVCFDPPYILKLAGWRRFIYDVFI